MEHQHKREISNLPFAGTKRNVRPRHRGNRIPLIIPRSRRPITPGEVLREDYLSQLQLTQAQLAEALGVHRTTVNEIINGQRAITPDMAIRLGHAFSTTPEYWLNLQKAVDLYDAKHSKLIDEVEKLPVLVS